MSYFVELWKQNGGLGGSSKTVIASSFTDLSDGRPGTRAGGGWIPNVSAHVRDTGNI
jgi:hypothetical protein